MEGELSLFDLARLDLPTAIAELEKTRKLLYRIWAHSGIDFSWGPIIAEVLKDELYERN